MSRKLLLLVLVTALSVTACLEDSRPQTTLNTATTLKVDLGAVVRADAVEPVDGITSAGQPNEAAFTVFAEQGYATVIDLRAEDEDRGLDEAAVLEKLGMSYIKLPIADEESVSFDSARKLDQLIAESNGPVLVHCKSGNRVGALLALRESLGGADDAAALAYGKAGGMTRLEDHVKKVLSKD